MGQGGTEPLLLQKQVMEARQPKLVMDTLLHIAVSRRLPVLETWPEAVLELGVEGQHSLLQC
jgi:hypothetical protein